MFASVTGLNEKCKFTIEKLKLLKKQNRADKASLLFCLSR